MANRSGPARQNTDSAPLSRHLVAVSSALRRRVSDGLQARGHTLTPSVSQLVPNLPESGMGMSALAALVQQSIQRTGQLVQQLEEDGYVERIQDESDGRAKRVVYTRRGRKLLRDIAELQDEITREFRSVLGAGRFDALLEDLAELDVALNGEEVGLRVATGR